MVWRSQQDGSADSDSAARQSAPWASASALGPRIRAWRKRRGLTMVQLAQKISVSQSAVSQWETGREAPARENLVRLASALELSVAALLGEREPVASTLAPSVETAGLAPMPVDVPVYGTAVGGAGGDFRFNGQVVDHVRRPPGVTRLRNMYALWVTGDSMVPWNGSGDLIFVSPARPAAPGDHVVVELFGACDGEPGTAMVKRLVARTATQLRLRQYNPEQTFCVPLAQVKAVHRVLSLRDLLGV